VSSARSGAGTAADLGDPALVLRTAGLRVTRQRTAVLRALERAGLIRRIEPAGSPALYELRVGDNHHHLVCRGCGRTTDVACVVGAAPCLVPGGSHGYLVDEAEVTSWGVCPGCREDPTVTGA
jgi:Fe2+ or Zn2+ uptake regulation protein